ncbi:MAG TPA: FTR1 family protein [Gemmatimonadaceae bacterium]|nr:FTR1 family protein [Gemmatimonadaceae bacterium]
MKRASGRWIVALIASAAIIALLAAIAVITAGGSPNPSSAESATARVVDIAVLVFREGLESILVISAITATMNGAAQPYRRPIGLGAMLGGAASIATWLGVVRLIDSLADNISALEVQAATGLLAIVVLVVVMNWFFHKVYWTGWIGMHTQRKQRLIARAADREITGRHVLFGLAVLGFTSVYREGFEIVLFLQSYRLQWGAAAVGRGVVIGLVFTAAVAVLAFVAHRRLPYKRMLIVTGVMLGAVLLVMVGEQAQEMQLAHWLSTTPLPSLDRLLPNWMGLWFSVFPTVETLAAQGIAAALVLGSYWFVRLRAARGAD